MGLNDEVEALRRIPLFARIEASRLKLLTFTGERRVFEAGEELFRQGDAGDAAYVITDGEAEVIAETAAGPVVVATRRQGDVIGEMAILCEAPRSATIRARRRMEALVISKALFNQLLHEFPEIAVEVARVLAARLDAATRDLSEARRGTGEAGG